MAAISPLSGTHSITSSTRHMEEIVRDMNRGDIHTSPSYQRGAAWTTAQRANLIRSILMELPIPAVVFGSTDFDTADWNVIDGKQRLETIRAWFNGELAVPAEWFYSEHLATADQPMVTYTDLTRPARRKFSNLARLDALFATVDSEAQESQEAQLYLLLNTAGTPQTEADLANAAGVAGAAPEESFSVNLGTAGVRAEMREAPHYTEEQITYIDGLDDSTIGAAVSNALTDHFWSAHDEVRSDAITALLTMPGAPGINDG